MRFGSTGWRLALPGYALALWMVLVYPPSLAAQSNRGQAVTAAGIPALIRSVLENVSLSGNIVKRLEAQRKLAAYGKRDRQSVVPVLIRELQRLKGYDKKATAQRLALISVLRDMGAAAEAAVPALTRIAKDQNKRNEWASLHAQGALAAIGTPSADNAVSAAARRSLERWLATATPADIDKAVRQHDFLIRQALRQTTPNEKMIEASLMLLFVVGRQANAAAPTLRRLYDDQRTGPELRQSLVQTLAAMGISDLSATTDTAPAEAKQASDPLAESLSDIKSKDPLIAALAMSELARLGPSKRVIDALIDALQDNHNPGEAARVLGSFGPAAAHAIPHLVPYLKDRVAGPNAIQAVGKIGLPDPVAISVLRQITADGASHLRGQAALALGKLQAETALPELTLALNAAAKYDRILAAKALGMIGPAAINAVPALTRLLQDPDTDIRLASVQTLGQIGPPAAVAVAEIARHLVSSDGRLKEGAEKALAKIGGSEAEILLARDAKRYARADQLAYRRLQAAGQEAGIGDLLQRLPKARALQVARAMLEDTNPNTAVLASAFLIQAGDIEVSIPRLVDLAAGGAVEGKTLTGLGWLLGHANSKAQLQDINQALRAYLNDHMGRYNATEQSRIRRAFGLSLEGRDGVAR
ncbi:MAG: HEAT repeat domain-containing protein [bacterium]|nr:HEAT repeat domain-containing protein [bacterium]